MAIRKSLLPSAYQQVKYIESTGTQYIDTGLTITENSKLEVDYLITQNNGNNYFFGTRLPSVFGCSNMGGTTNPPQIAVNVSGTWGGAHIVSTNTRYNLVIDLKNNNASINGSSLALPTYTSFTAENMFLFAYNGSGTPTAFASMRYYNFKVYSNDVLVNHLIPCYRKSDSVIGMYDLVNGVFYTNAGSGDFTKGNDVMPKVKHIYKDCKDVVRQYSQLPAGYIPLDYIENPNENAYINTGILPDDTIGFKVRMSVNNTLTDLYYLGCRESNQTDSRFGLGVYQGHTYMALGIYYSDVNNWTITRDKPFVAENNYKNSRVATMDGLYPVSVGSLTGITFTRNIYLFKSNQATTQLTANCRIYDCEITQGTTVVAHFIPCLDNNGVACMYDTVRQQTFYSAGSSDFITDYVPPITIPSGYTLLEYLESDGNQYIDTDYIANQTTNIECDFMVLQHNGTLLNYVYGEYVSGKACGIYISSNSVYGVLYGTTDRNTSIPRFLNEKVHSVFNSVELVINGVADTVGYSGTYTATKTLYLFKGNGSSRPGMIGRIYYMLIREARGVAVRYLVPCLDNNNVPCMYDVITKQTYYNAGTGTFVAGRAVPPPTTKRIIKQYKGTSLYFYDVPSIYQRVKYIEATGTQYINTGIETAYYEWNLYLTFQRGATMGGTIFGATGGFEVYLESSQPNYKAQNTTSNVQAQVGTFNNIRLRPLPVANGVITLTVDGISNTMGNVVYSYGNTIGLCGRGDGTNLIAGLFGEFKVQKGSKTLIHLLPCYRKSDNVVGMYDIVSGKFFTNDGTGTFGKGADL